METKFADDPQQGGDPPIPPFRYKPGYASDTKQVGGRPRGSRTRIKTRQIIQLAPKIGDLDVLVAAGRRLDLVGLCRGLVAICGERLLREIDDADNDRKHMLAECAAAFSKIAIETAKIGGGDTPKDITPAAKSAAPAFTLSQFRERAAAKTNSDPST
jgi:hypothetical protein